MEHFICFCLEVRNDIVVYLCLLCRFCFFHEFVIVHRDKLFLIFNPYIFQNFL